MLPTSDLHHNTMKHILLTIALGLSTLTAQAQWKAERHDNPIDGPYVIAYTPTVNGAWLKMFQYRVDSVYAAVGLILGGGYTCTDNPSIELALKVDGTWVKYSLTGLTSKDKERVYLTTDILGTFGNDFAKASQIMIRLDDEHCGVDNHTFSMAGSAAALKIMAKPL